MRGQLRGQPFSMTATGSTLASATQTAVASRTHYVTDVTFSTDKAGAIALVKDGATTIWQTQVGDIGSDTSHYETVFSTPLAGTPGNALNIQIDGTSVCKANASGYYLP